MNTDSTLLQRLKNTKTKELTKTEKHRCAKVEDAYDHELIKQSKNRAMLGKFLVFFVMGIFLTLGLLFIFMIFLYGRGLVGDCFKLEGHYIIGGNTDPEELSDQEVVNVYKEQYQVERGFRFLKDPLFFVSSLFVKTPQRIMALLMVMLLSLLVYGIAERRMRACLASQKETLPNQIQQATEAPTLRWVFQLLLGIHCLKISTENQSHQMIEGLTPLREKISLLFGPTVAEIYQLSYG
ncbi:hypothetical protein bplSymb_SCF02802P017 [Bathymodiolus platifrons methanotrophic gill symbiont]|uniref:IS1634 family transposase n=1 Tax=Bathymodiolus platifrons methanotrophic gill symbiont TaxID=113268 RepID=UPI000B41149A|nr:IS1634 family transposase [Bathymodiolus platifrons methanotrophic gill symbiont]GAW86477.1 hypothetical protein bplSymb_SCF02802P017 [Bathymodiolus platifrons methanotrophic gill symbiont]GFO76472.1 transposase [Bathymodiolus platifrons methanotrophic gill symbiont]